MIIKRNFICFCFQNKAWENKIKSVYQQKQKYKQRLEDQYIVLFVSK